MRSYLTRNNAVTLQENGMKADEDGSDKWNHVILKTEK